MIQKEASSNNMAVVYTLGDAVPGGRWPGRSERAAGGGRTGVGPSQCCHVAIAVRPETRVPPLGPPLGHEQTD